MKIDLLDPVVEAAPGETTVCRVRVLNDTAGPSAYRLRIVGLNNADLEYPLGYDPLPAGTQASFDVSILVPPGFAAGRHALALEVLSDRRGEQPALAGMTVEVSSIQKVAVRVNPSTITGRTKGRFNVEIDNREGRQLDLDLRGEGLDLEFALARDRISLRPGDTVAIPGAVRGKRRLVRDPIHHVMTIVAESNSAPVYADAAFDQRPLFPRRLRIGMAFLALLALWAGILGAGVYWWAHRDTTKNEEAFVDANHDGQPDAPLGSTPAAGSTGGASAQPSGGTGVGAGAAGGQSGSGANPGTPKATSTSVSGTVKAADTGDNGGVTVTLRPATLGGQPRTEAQAAAFARGNPGASRPEKVWPARSSRPTSLVSSLVATESLPDQVTGDKGVWNFPSVAIPDNYEVTFSKPGFNTKAFVVTPPESGKAVQLDVTLDTAEGTASGTVFGPNGRLGGVDIVISDGDLTFTTKSSSEAADLGTWKVAGLSTPNTYTLTASLRGFGTEVVQVKLDPGEKRTGVNVTMHAGVGSISGHVLSGAAPLGGVQITASSGDLTRQTTSLTLGDEGFYSLPQLKIPGTYTLTAVADGYVTQTREVTLGGNAADIDFSLIRTTGTITGVVKDDVAGNLEGVGITIKHDNLMFTATTAGGAHAGEFTIDQLPPGQYLVNFTRFDHLDTSQLITIAAGEVKDLGTILMKFQGRPPLAETGRLVVDVFDSGTTGLKSATVTVIKASDGSVVRTATDAANAQSTFAFDNVPIGTYSIHVTKEGYRPASRPISIGLSEVKTELHLLQKGQVSFRLFDSTSVSNPKPTQLANYVAAIYLLKNDGTRIDPPVQVHANQPADANGDIFWESDPSSLLEGTYEVVISKAPDGYRVLPQMLDPDPAVLPIPANFMKFTIGPTDQGAIPLKDLLANPYPKLMGIISAPVAQQPDGSVTFDTLQQAAVTLRCPGSTPETSSVAETPPGSSTYLYVFSSVQVQNATDNSKDCKVDVNVTSPAGYPLTTIDYTNAFEPGDAVRNDLVLNIAVNKTPAPIGGTVYWIDGSDSNPLTRIHKIGTVTITSEGPVITGFKPSATGSPTPVPDPALPGVVLTGTNIGGDWSIVGQVFGKTTYVFQATNNDFITGKLTVDITNSGRVVQEVAPVIANDNSGSIDVQLQPVPGSISGTVAIDSVGTKQFSAVTITGTGPGGAITPVTPGAGGAYTIPAAAGSWSLNFNPPPHHVLGQNEISGYQHVVQPNEQIANINTRFVELGSIDVTVVDQNGNAIDVNGTKPTVMLSRTGTGAPGDPGAAAATPIALNAGVGAAADLPVNLVTGTTSAADYHLDVDMPGYDIENANVAVTNIAGGYSNAAMLADDIPVPLLAGGKATVTIKLAKYGSLVGSVEGVVVGGAIEALPMSPQLTITATRVATLTPGQPIPTNPPIVITPVGNSFQVAGPPGLYTITVDHQYFLAGLVSGPTDPDPSVPIGQFKIVDEPAGTPVPPPPVLTPPFRLAIAPGFAVVNAVDSGGNPITGATVTVTDNGVNQTQPTVNGIASFPGLLPGDYSVEIRSKDATNQDDKFPVMVKVTVPRGDRNDDAARTVTLRATLLGVASKISGKVGAFNTAGRPVPLPVTATLNRRLVSSSTAVENGSPTANSATEADLSNPPALSAAVGQNAPAQVPPQAPADPRDFAFDKLPEGLHRLTLTDATGYKTPTVADVLVSNTSPEFAFPTPNHSNAASIWYEAQNVTVDVQVRSGSANGALLTGAGVNVSLIAPIIAPATQGVTLTAGPTSSGATATYTNVIPETADYELKVTAPLHADYDQAEPIGVVTDGTLHITLIAVMNPNAGEVTGVAQRQVDNATPPTIQPLPAVGSVRLLTAAGAQVGPAVTPDGTGHYTLGGITTAGSYKVEVSDTHFSTVQSAPFNVALGVTTSPPTVPTVTIIKLAKMTINVTPATATATVNGVDQTATKCSAGVCTFDDLVPGTSYTFTFSATNFNSHSETWTPPVGGVDSRAVTLTQRTVTVTVTTEGSATDANTATVKLFVPVGTDLGTPTHVAGTATYVFSGVPFGAGEVQVSRTGYRDQTVPVGVNPASPPPVNLKKLVTITGQVTAPGSPTGNGSTMYATNTDVPQQRIDGTISGNDYTISGLPAGTWTVHAEKDGVGAGTAGPFTITSTSTPSTYTSQDIVLTARPVVFSFQVTSSPLAGVVVAMGGSTSAASDSTGKTTLSILETAVPSSLDWTATLSGKRDGHGTIAAGSFSDNVAVFDPIGGTVSVAGAGQSGANVYMCTSNATVAQCDNSPNPSNGNTLAGPVPTTGSTGAFTFATANPPPGTYRLRALWTDPADNTKKYGGSLNVTIGASGAITSPSGAITIPMTLLP